MAVIHETRRTYMHGGRPVTVVVQLTDDAYKDCTEEEIRARRRDFEETALRLVANARAREERKKAAADTA